MALMELTGVWRLVTALFANGTTKNCSSMAVQGISIQDMLIGYAKTDAFTFVLGITRRLAQDEKLHVRRAPELQVQRRASALFA